MHRRRGRTLIGSINTKFFTSDHNNSGGSFDEDKDDGIGYRVCIEAVDEQHAIARAENIGIEERPDEKKDLTDRQNSV